MSVPAEQFSLFHSSKFSYWLVNYFPQVTTHFPANDRSLYLYKQAILLHTHTHVVSFMLPYLNASFQAEPTRTISLYLDHYNLEHPVKSLPH